MCIVVEPVRPRPRPRWPLKVVADAGVFALAVLGAFLLRFDGVVDRAHPTQVWLLLLTLPLLRLLVGRAVGTHRTSWRLLGLPEVIKLIRAIALVTAALVAIRLAMPWLAPGVAVVPLGVIALEGLLAGTGTLVLRIGMRVFDEYRARERVRATVSNVRRLALLVGAGRAGRMTARELRQRPDAGFEPVGFLDDDPTRRGQVIEGVPVLGTTAQAAQIAALVGAQDIILTLPSASRTLLRRIVERCRATGLPVQTVPGLYELISGKVGITRIRPLAIEALLGRDVVQLDDHAARQVASAFRGKRIVVTGAGGSIGSELCRQLAALQPAALVLFECSENGLFEIEQEMLGLLGDRAIAFLGDVRNEEHVELAFSQHRPDVVVHAAAYKHVPMMERHPEASVDNNVRGTRVLVAAAHTHRVGRFVLVSTDKAVNPTSLMGASKRVAELLVHQRHPGSRTRCCAVRFGNVLGSRGSVLHTFARQIESGGPLTVTHADITRFFMTIPEAVRLVLQAGAMGRGGETFLLDMGESIRIIDMARQMIHLAGLSEDEVPIEIVGLRPGEKLHEELLRDGESSVPSGTDGILIAVGGADDGADVPRAIAALERAARRRDIPELRRVLGRLTGYLDPGAASACSAGHEVELSLVASA